MLATADVSVPGRAGRDGESGEVIGAVCGVFSTDVNGLVAVL